MHASRTACTTAHVHASTVCTVHHHILIERTATAAIASTSLATDTNMRPLTFRFDGQLSMNIEVYSMACRVLGSDSDGQSVFECIELCINCTDSLIRYTRAPLHKQLIISCEHMRPLSVNKTIAAVQTDGLRQRIDDTARA